MGISLSTIGGSEVNLLPSISKEAPERKVEAQKFFEHAEACDKSGNYSTASVSYQKAAELGHTEAMVKLGDYFMNGRGMWKEQETAAKWYQKAAELENPSAMTKYGLCFQRGEGVAKDTNRAVKWYQRAADLNHPEGLYRLAQAYKAKLAEPKGLDDGVETLLERAVQLEFPSAFGELGHIYLECSHGLKGEELELRKKKMVDLFKKGVSLGDATSMRFLGLSYKYGWGGLERSIDKFVEFMHKAARCNDLNAIRALGNCYNKGNGVEQNFEKAAEMWKQGVSLGDVGSMLELAICFQNGNGVAQDLPRAAELYREVIRLDSRESYDIDLLPAAAEHLGHMFWEGGEGMPKDSRQAVRFLRQAVLYGSVSAREFLNEMLQDE